VSACAARSVGKAEPIDNSVLVADVKPALVAKMLYPAAAELMLKLPKVAMPPLADIVVVPVNTPLPGLASRLSVTGFDAVVTTFPCASKIEIWTAGVIVAPSITLVG
jgi:hypothetical protein